MPSQHRKSPPVFPSCTALESRVWSLSACEYETQRSSDFPALLEIIVYMLASLARPASCHGGAYHSVARKHCYIQRANTHSVNTGVSIGSCVVVVIRCEVDNHLALFVLAPLCGRVTLATASPPLTHTHRPVLKTSFRFTVIKTGLHSEMRLIPQWTMNKPTVCEGVTVAANVTEKGEWVIVYVSSSSRPHRINISTPYFLLLDVSLLLWIPLHSP